MKILLPLAIGLLMLLIMPAGLALADNGPHGGYTATTDACAGCHRAHTAPAAQLLIDTVPNLCYSCHGNTATGADTDVVDGIYDGLESGAGEGTVGRGLKGGGFTNALMDTDWDGAAVSAPTTSSHLVDGSTGTAWGNGAIGSGAGATAFSLSCVSCHDPHGGASTTGGATYRLLRAIPTGSGAGSGVDVTDEAAKLYTVSDSDKKSGNQYFGEGYNSPGSTWEQIDLQERELSSWCQQCHTRYLATSESGHTDSGDPIFAYRHMARGSPVGPNCTFCHDWTLPTPPFLKTTSGPVWNHYVECMTCHVAHGTSASMGGYAGIVAWPDSTTTPSGNGRSSLLRVDNRGTCQLCHGK